MSLAKALAHATEVHFGEVRAVYHDGRWRVSDARGYRQGARMVVDGLLFDEAVSLAYRVSVHAPGTKVQP